MERSLILKANRRRSLARCGWAVLFVLIPFGSFLMAQAHTPARDARIETISPCASADAFVFDGNPGTNYGQEDFLRAGYGMGQNEPFSSRILVQFDLLSLLPKDSIITEAVFSMELINADGPPSGLVSLTLYDIREPWDELLVTWANQPAIDTIAPVTQATIDLATPQIVTWDITLLAQSWVLNPHLNYGFELKGPEGGDMWRRLFTSRHPSGYCPTLAVTYTSSEPGPTLTLTPTPTLTLTPTPVCPSGDLAGDTRAAAAPITPNSGSPVEELICPSGDVDIWKFHVDSNQEVVVYLSWDPVYPERDYNLFLLDSAGGFVASSELWGTTYESIRTVVYTPGDYYVSVIGRGVADWSNKDPYRLWVETSYVCFDDEAGETFAAAALLPPSLPQGGSHNPKYGLICPSGDQDWYRFDVSAGQGISAALTELPADYSLALFDPTGNLVAESKNSGLADELINFTANVNGSWRVQVKGALPTTASSGYYRLEVSLTSSADLSIEGIEVTQAIQTMNPGVLKVSLIDGKPTRARVYVSTGPSPGPVSFVTVELHGYSYGGGVLTELSPVLTQSNKTVQSGPMLNTQRLDTAGSFNFLFPDSWLSTASGTVYDTPLFLKGIVNPGPTVPETDFSNNTYKSDPVSSSRTPPVTVIFVPIRTNGVTANPMGNPDLNASMAWMEATFPASLINFGIRNTVLESNQNFALTTSGACGPGWSNLLSDLADLSFWMAWSGDLADNTFLFGVLPPTSLIPHSNVHGCGRLDDNVAAGFIDAQPFVLTHEMGHNFDRIHAPCTTPGGGYPNYTDPSGNPYPVGSIGEVGYNVVTGQVFDPASFNDVMSCGNHWISPYTHGGILSYLRDLSTSRLRGTDSMAGPYLVVSGHASAGQLESLRPMWVLSEAPGGSDESGTGPYSLELQDAQGNKLFLRSFDVGDPFAGEDRDRSAFRQIVPFKPGTARIVFRYLDTILRTIQVSAHAPAVTVTSPNGGESWDGSGAYSITWQASDADGDPLAANVFYSPDGGATWQPLAVNLNESHYEVSGLDLAGSTQALIRVQVSDGVNTTADDSDMSFTVGLKGPQVMIFHPLNGAFVIPSQEIILHGSAHDLEQGALVGDSLVWTSSLDGPLGTGKTLAVSQLSQGRHEISLTAVDADGMTSSATRVVYVMQPLNYYLPLIVSR
jgi:hypothetical protein